MEELKFDKVKLRKANVKVFKLVQKIIKSKRRDSDGHTIKKRTGNLLSNIKPVFSIDNNNQLIINISMMQYYQYLDEGTVNIEPWFLTDDILNSDELINITKELVGDAVQGAIVQTISDINKTVKLKIY